MSGIVVGFDGSEGGAQALAWVGYEAQLHDLPLTAVLAWDWLDQQHTVLSEGFGPGYGVPDALAALNAHVEEALGPSRAATRGTTAPSVT